MLFGTVLRMEDSRGEPVWVCPCLGPHPLTKRPGTGERLPRGVKPVTATQVLVYFSTGRSSVLAQHQCLRHYRIFSSVASTFPVSLQAEGCKLPCIVDKGKQQLECATTTYLGERVPPSKDSSHCFPGTAVALLRRQGAAIVLGTALLTSGTDVRCGFG